MKTKIADKIEKATMLKSNYNYNFLIF